MSRINPMVRKCLYLSKRQEEGIQLAKKWYGIPESELIRRLLDAYLKENIWDKEPKVIVGKHETNHEN